MLSYENFRLHKHGVAMDSDGDHGYHTLTGGFHPHPGRGSPLSPTGQGASSPGLPCVLQCQHTTSSKAILGIINQTLPSLWFPWYHNSNQSGPSNIEIIIATVQSFCCQSLQLYNPKLFNILRQGQDQGIISFRRIDIQLISDWFDAILVTFMP